jgi:signal peptidase
MASDDAPAGSRASSSAPSGFMQGIRDVVFAVVAVVIIIAAVFAYSGVWPPMVVVESGSMMHHETDSALGIIDTGDLTLTKGVQQESDIITYQQGVRQNVRSYGNFGEVVIYAKNGHFEQTPIIHRAITRLVYHPGNGTYDLPEAFPPRFGLTVGAGLVDIGSLWTWDAAHPDGAEVNLTLNLTRIVTSMAGYPHSGFITKGDHNGQIDQGQLSALAPEGHPGSGTVEPVMGEWLVGKAEGELPWFGLIKLWAGGAKAPLPPNSQRNLVIAIIVILAGPYLIERGWDRYGEGIKAKVPLSWKKRYAGMAAKMPGAKGRAERREAWKAAEEARLKDIKRRGRR